MRAHGSLETSLWLRLAVMLVPHCSSPPSSVASACTSLAFFYSQNSCRCDSSFPGRRNVSPSGPADGMGWGLGRGLGLFVQDVLRGKKERWSSRPTPPNPWIPWLKITASWAYMLIHAYIRANRGSWWIKKKPDRATAAVKHSLVML